MSKEAPEATIEAKARFNRSTKYHVSIKGVSYGRCKKYWDDFEELYDSLQQTHSKYLEDLPFPNYATRKDHTKQDAVESNRENLERLLTRMLRHPQLSRSEQVVSFLQLTDFVADEEPEGVLSSAAQAKLSGRPGPTPATVKPVYHNTALDEADEADDDDFTPALDERGAFRGADGRTGAASGGGGKNGRPAPSESSNTIWIGR
jgi:hypothetical protein